MAGVVVKGVEGILDSIGISRAEAERLSPLTDESISAVKAIVPSSHCVVEAATAALCALAISLDILRGCDDDEGAARIDVDPEACVAEFLSERLLRVGGVHDTGNNSKDNKVSLWDPLSGLYRASDGRFVRLHTNFPAHRKAAVSAVCGPETGADSVTRAQFEGAISRSQLTSFEIEDRVYSAGGVAVALRSLEKWSAHPQCVALNRKGALLTIDAVKVEGDVGGDAYTAARGSPLSGVSVVDLTHVIAGPVATRCLAHHGADVAAVLRPNAPVFVPEDMLRDKTCLTADIGTCDGKGEVLDRIRHADVVVQSYRPGAVERSLGRTSDLLHMMF